MDLVMFFTAVVMAVLIGVSLLVAFTRKGSVATVAMTARRIKLHTAAPPPEMVYTWHTQHCPAGYSVEDHDAARGIVILASRPTAFTWGFFYPAVIHAEGAGTRVDLGIKSKLIQYGPGVRSVFAHGIGHVRVVSMDTVMT